MTRQRFLLISLAIWLTAAICLIVWRAHAIAWDDFVNPDDQLRLVEVRDWLAGQSFWDVSQHRMNQPFGAPMHWSRLVDMPLAAVDMLLAPFIGAQKAELVSAVFVPLVTLATVMILAGLITRRLAGPRIGLVAVVMAACCPDTILQMFPLRVDHHGWQVTCSMLAIFAALDPRGRRSGMIAGASIAVALQISLEALPFAAALGGVFGLAWCLDPSDQQRQRLVGYLAALCATETLLFLTLHTPSVYTISYCDAISPPQLSAFFVALAGCAGGAWFAPQSRWTRLAALAATGALAGAAFRAFPPHCGLDAFSALEPITRKLWYDNVLEGLPFWKLKPIVAASAIGFPLVGLVCTAVVLKRSPASERTAWLTYGLLLAAATAVAMMVQRAGALANVAATPAVAAILFPLLVRAHDSRHMLVRVCVTPLLCLTLSPIAASTVVVLFTPVGDSTKKAVPTAAPASAGSDRPCVATEYVRGLSVLPPSRMLTPLDLAPSILLQTQHAPLASGHHRNHVAMSEVLTAFTGSDDTAHAIIRARGLRYVVMCTDFFEIVNYRKVAPTGFAAQLTEGHAPDWLKPIVLPGNPIRLWQVKD